MSRRFTLGALSLLFGVGMVIAAACGATDLEAPRADESQAAASLNCRSFSDLMPAFTDAVRSGRTGNLALVVQRSLVTSEGGTPPMPDVLRAVTSVMTQFAQLPPERGAPDGQLCTPSPPGAGLTLDAGLPPLSQSNPMCEMRRAMEVLVHEGRANSVLSLVDPHVAGLLNYIIGRDRRDPSKPVTPHFEVADVVSGMCEQNNVCRMSDVVDLLIALSAWQETPQARLQLDHINTLMADPEMDKVLAPEANADAGTALGGETGVVALSNTVLTSILGMQSPNDLDALMNNPLLQNLAPSLRTELQTVLADTKVMLDPARDPRVLPALKKTVNCYRTQDSSVGLDGKLTYKGDLVLMLYRLGLEERLPQFGITWLLATGTGLVDIDERHTLTHLGGTFAKAIRDDEQAMDSMAMVCHQLLSTKPLSGQAKSNAELALPVIADLFNQGIASEAMCAMDSVAFGCTGGEAPACGVDGGR